jgi:hypothetical protein
MSNIEHTLQERTQPTAQEISSKIEQMVRLGLMPVQDLPYLKRALMHVRSNMFLPLLEREVYYRFVNELINITIGNPAVLRLIKNKTGPLRREETEMPSVIECTVDEGKAENKLKKRAYLQKKGKEWVKSNAIGRRKESPYSAKLWLQIAKSKNTGKQVRAGRSAMQYENKAPITNEEVSYGDRFQAALDQFEIQNLNELNIEDTKAFLAFVDTYNEEIISAANRPKGPISVAVKDEMQRRKEKKAADTARLMASAKKEYDAKISAAKTKSASDPSRNLFKQDRAKQ